MYINLFRKSEAELSLAMPSNCTAYKCSNNSDQGFALFRYPHDEALRQKWVAAVGRGKDWSPKSSQKLCEIHFMPSDIEFVAGRKRVKAGAFPSRFCTCTTENREHPRKKQTSRSEPYRRQDSVGNNKQGKLKQINHCDHTYDGSALDQRTPLSVINTYNGMTYPRKRQGFSVQHQYDRVQFCKSLTKEEIQSTTKSQEIVEEPDKLQSIVEDDNSLQHFLDENKQLRSEMKQTVEEVLKITKKTDASINVNFDEHYTEEYRKLCKENSELKQQLKILSECVQLTDTVLTENLRDFLFI